jgi:hypothetical protein
VVARERERERERDVAWILTTTYAWCVCELIGSEFKNALSIGNSAKKAEKHTVSYKTATDKSTWSLKLSAMVQASISQA